MKATRFASRLAWVLLGVGLSSTAFAETPARPTTPARPSQPTQQPAQPGATGQTGQVGQAGQARQFQFPAIKTPSDGSVAGILKETNKFEIDLANGAADKATNPQVKQYATQVMTDWKTSDQSLDDVAKRANIKTEDNDATKSVRQMGDQMKDQFKNLEGAAYDRAYVDHEVAFNSSLMNYIDNQLIPNAQNANLKQLLTSQRQIVSTHLDAAKRLQSSLMQGPQGTQ
jgi:putative membrane protein